MNSWVCIWVMLELNTLSFCALVKGFKNKKHKTTEWAIKYFVIQSISSALLIFGAVSSKARSLDKCFFVLGTTIIIIKIAASPFQQWFVKIRKNSSWVNATILITWQKLAPTYLVLYLLKSIIYLFVAASVRMGAVLQINKKWLLEIMALSSVFNLGWMLIAIQVDTKSFFLFLTVYWLSVIILITLLAKSDFKEVSQVISKKYPAWIFFLRAINLAGIPPLPNFIAKILILKTGLKINLPILMTLMLIVSSLNLFIYFRVFRGNLAENYTASQKFNIKNRIWIGCLIILFAILSVLVIRS